MGSFGVVIKFSSGTLITLMHFEGAHVFVSPIASMALIAWRQAAR